MPSARWPMSTACTPPRTYPSTWPRSARISMRPARTSGAGRMSGRSLPIRPCWNGFARTSSRRRRARYRCGSRPVPCRSPTWPGWPGRWITSRRSLRLGAAVARAFAAAGDRVAVHYGGSRAAAEKVRDDLAGAGHTIVQADLADPEAVRRMVDAAAAALGGIDVLVNNAGVYPDNRIDEDDYAAWQQAWKYTLDVNLLGAVNATWCAVRHMRAGGRIVNVSSRGAFRGEPNHLAYGASKGALN